MNCLTCGIPLQEGVPCPACAAQQAAPAYTAIPVQQATPLPAMPSLYRLKCPDCGHHEMTVMGVKGGGGRGMATTLAFGAIGNLVAGSMAKDNRETVPIQYRCTGCKRKFESGPLIAEADEYLPAPSNIHFERPGSFVGMAVPQIVYLNGIKIGPVGNGKALDFPTYLRYNTLFVTDQHGAAFKGSYKFEAAPGGNVHVRFNRKFM